MKGVILAAGRGTRISVKNGIPHKVLLKVKGRAIIDYVLESYSAVGITDLAIVIGHQGNSIREWVGNGSKYGIDVHYVFNSKYMRGNALSVYAVRSFTGSDTFVLSMADHMLSSPLLQRITEMNSRGNVLAVDFRPSSRHVIEGTRVMVDDDNMVTSIGKKITRWNGIDAGAFQLTSAIFDSIADILREERVEYQLSQAVSRMIGQGHALEACDITGCVWQDVDTWEDLMLVRENFVGARRWEYFKKV